MATKNTNTDYAIEISTAANGFIVIPTRDTARGNGLYDPLVFQSMQGLIDFLQAHFSHRCQHVAADEGGAS